MRIAYLSGARLPSGRANSIQTVRMCHEFSRQGNSVCLYAAHESGADQTIHQWYGLSENVRVRVFPWSLRWRWNSLFFSRAVTRDVRSGSLPDIFYGRHLLGLYMVRKLGVPVIYEAHMPERDFMDRLLYERLFKSPNFVRLVTVSRALAEYYRQTYPALSESMIVVSPNGADDPWVSGRPSPIQLPGRSGRLRVGYVGSLHPWKGIATFVEISRRMPEVDFYLVGGSDLDLIDKTGSRVGGNFFALGLAPPNEVPRYLEAFDVVLAPYRNSSSTTKRSILNDDTVWGSPLKIFEYLAAGACIIASDLPIIRELLEDGEDCILCDPLSPSAWVSAIERLRSSESLRKRLRKNARKSFLENYSRETRVKSVLDGIA